MILNAWDDWAARPQSRRIPLVQCAESLSASEHLRLIVNIAQVLSSLAPPHYLIACYNSVFRSGGSAVFSCWTKADPPDRNLRLSRKTQVIGHGRRDDKQQE